MNVTVIGWYGTETLGDVAILDGILSITYEIENKNNIFLGSLYPFYTERTLFEEKTVFSISAPNTIISIFNVKDLNTCRHMIDNSDLVLIGGGPLMNLEELYLLKKCFQYAKKKKIPRMVFGCGIEDLSNPIYIKVVQEIFNNSSKIILRDQLAKNRALDLYGNSFEFLALGDPAVVSIENYVNTNNTKKNNIISVNFREYSQNEYGNAVYYSDDEFKKIIKILDKKYEQIKLVPMHTFFIGGDDRYYLESLIQGLDLNNTDVIHKPNNLHELYSLFSSSLGCIGMRYHSIVMQTILNGNNLVLNYTNPKEGKISGFINSLQTDFYQERTIYLQKKERIDLNKWIENLDRQNNVFNYKKSKIKEDYINILRTVLESK